jgi:hypothetical protein
MGYYSFIVQAPGEVILEKQRVILDQGMNAFNALIDDLDVFLVLLKKEGVSVTKVNRLDMHEPVTPQPEILEAQQAYVLPTRGDD